MLGEYKCHFAGQPYLTGETPYLIKKDISVLMLVGISIMIVVLLVNLRSIYAVMCGLCVIFLSLLHVQLPLQQDQFDFVKSF